MCGSQTFGLAVSDVSSFSAGFLEQLEVLFQDEDPSVRMKTCELLHIVSTHSIGR